jgi:hypothetical protein
MKPAKRLEKIGLWFKGPYSADLFKQIYIEPEDFETVAIGTGESKDVALTRALAHLNGKGYGPIMVDIVNEARHMAPAAAIQVEGDEYCAVYCILGVTAER